MLALVGFVGLCLLVGLVGSSMTNHAIPGWYRLLQKPPGTPPGWVFAPAWLGLYVMIGVAGWLVWKRIGSSAPLRLWGWQLAANAAWAPSFFGLRRLSLGMAVIIVLLVLIGLTIRSFRRVSRPAALLLVPYLGWCLYAAYLNAGFLLLNHA